MTPSKVSLLDARTSRVLITILLFAAGLAFVYAARGTLILFLFAISFAYVIDPVVEGVARWLKGSRPGAIAAIYLAIAAGVAIFFVSVGPRLFREGQDLTKTLPALYQRISTGQIAFQIGAQHGWSEETRNRIQQFLAAHSDSVDQMARSFGIRLVAIGANVWLFLLVPILAVFFLNDGAKLKAALLEMFERQSQRDFVEDVLDDVHRMLVHFIRAQLILAALTAVVFSLGLTVMRVPYGYVMGVIAGLLEFIPFVGPLLAAVLIVGVSIGTNYHHVLILMLFLAAWRVLQDYVTSPRIMGREVEVHPLLAVFGVLAGGEIGGIVGVYLSIPVIASLGIFWKHWRAYGAEPMIDQASDPAVLIEGKNRGA